MTTDVSLRHHGDAETAPGLAGPAVNVRRRPPPGWLTAELARTLGRLASVHPDPGARGWAGERRTEVQSFAVRRRGMFHGLGPGWRRITVRGPATSETFTDALREVL